MLASLEAWRRFDVRECNTASNKRDNLRASRREQYRLLARRLAQAYGVIRIGYVDLRAMSKRESAERKMSPAARRNRVRASLSLLRSEIEKQARKHGARV